MPNKVCDGITYSLPNFNGCTIQLNHVDKMAPVDITQNIRQISIQLSLKFVPEDQNNNKWTLGLAMFDALR